MIDVGMRGASTTSAARAPSELRIRYAAGYGGWTVVGDADRVAAAFAEIASAGFSGIAMGFVNYLDEFPFFRDEVLPRLSGSVFALPPVHLGLSKDHGNTVEVPIVRLLVLVTLLRARHTGRAHSIRRHPRDRLADRLVRLRRDEADAVDHVLEGVVDATDGIAGRPVRFMSSSGDPRPADPSVQITSRLIGQKVPITRPVAERDLRPSFRSSHKVRRSSGLSPVVARRPTARVPVEGTRRIEDVRRSSYATSSPRTARHRIHRVVRRRPVRTRAEGSTSRFNRLEFTRSRTRRTRTLRPGPI